MKNLHILMCLVCLSFFLKAQDWDYENAGTITDLVGTIQLENNLPIITSDIDHGKRYCPYMLDKDLQVDGLKIKVSGIRGAIPPNVRMMCTPLKITEASIVVSQANQISKPQETNFQWEKELKKATGTVKVLDNGELFVIVPDDNANMRYISQQLPAEYKKDGLKVSFTGWEGIIPPNFRMMGKPLKLKSICAAKGEKKKYKLKKGSYKFK